MTVLQIDNVTKTHGRAHSVRDVSLRVAAGECIALLGHNGAGKTTLLRMVLGLTPLSAGSIRLFGSPPGSRHARRLVGYLPENVAFHAALSGREQLRHFARLKSVRANVADDLLERVGLGDAADRRIATYSKGMRQRIGLAQALLGRPKLALLDEPTSGLDPISRHEFYDIVAELARSGTAVLLSSHALSELEGRTDRIAILSKGRLVADASLAQLQNTARLPIRVRVTTLSADADHVADTLGGERVNGQLVSLTCEPETKIAVLGQIAALGSLVRDVDLAPASLEELYRHYSLSAQEHT